MRCAMFLRLCVVGLLLGSCFSSFAQYRRGSVVCRDFEDAEAWYKAEPKNAGFKTDYAHCLIAKGQVNDGLWHLNEIMDHYSTPENIGATYLFAKYVKTKGTFKTLDYNALDQAIYYYSQTLFNINLSGNYPRNGYEETEAGNQIELAATYNIPYLAMLRFGLGASGHYKEHLLQSASYTGDRNLETYPSYSDSTLGSLDKAIESGTQCANLPNKRHFASDSYKNAKYICRTIVNAALKLKPLEERRLNTLNKYSCWSVLPNCTEYKEITRQMESIYNNTFAAIKDKTF